MATTETDWRARLALIAACVILIAWTISFTLDIAVESYDPHPSITPLAMAAVGFLFGGEVLSKFKANGKRPEEAKT